MYRQGDVLLIPTKSAGELGEEVVDKRGVVLAEGETSGHFHGLVGRGKLFSFRDSARQERLLRVESRSKVCVVGGEVGGTARHAALTIEVGDYVVRVQRTWTSANKSERTVD